VAVSWRPLPVPRDEQEPKGLGSSLDRLAASLGAPAPGLLGVVFARWPDLVGPDVAAHATPRSLRDGVLTVVVDHPAWATSLRMLAGDLLRRVAEAGEGEVAELVVHVDGGPRRPGRVANDDGRQSTARPAGPARRDPWRGRRGDGRDAGR
jgi:predicted nucleic acid-binding Zn ribbon protein